MYVICRDKRQFLFIGKRDQPLLGGALFVEPVTLQLDVQSIAEDFMEPVEEGAGGLVLPLDKQTVERSTGTAGERDQGLGHAADQSDISP